MFNDPSFNTHPSHEVIQIPLHFFPSKTLQKPSPLSNKSPALMIQSLFRGFLVRKTVNKLLSIRNQVCEVENNIKDDKFVELIGKDVKERLRVSERLMLLLLKLDSIRGVDFGVREFRKSVIRKVIVLQEVVDSIVVDCDRIVTEQVRAVVSVRNVDGLIDVMVEDMNVVDSIVVDDDDDMVRACETITEQVTDTDCVMNVDDVIDVTVKDVNVVDSVRFGEIVSEQVIETFVDDSVRSSETVAIGCGTVTEQDRDMDTDFVMNVDGLIDVTVDGVDLVRYGESVEIDCGVVTEQVTDTDNVNVDGVIDVTMDSVNVVDSIVDDIVGSGETVSEQVTNTDRVMNVDGLIDVTVEDVKVIEVNRDSVEARDEGTDDRKRSVQLLERLMDDNEKMTALMTQMFERDEMQTRMINSLSRRVEQLEKRFKPRKKKKMKMHSA